MTTSLSFGAAKACMLVGLDNKRFNEAVAKDLYQCAPAAKRGSERKFTEDDLIALFVYAQLLAQDVSQRVAGKVACKVRSKIDEDPEAKEVKIFKLKETEREGLSETTVHIYWIFDVAGMRKYLRDASGAMSGDENE